VQKTFAVSRETMAALSDYVRLLATWQTRVNLVSSGTMGDVWGRHIADSLQLIDLAPAAATAWVDLGSGGGLPGLPIALALRERPGFHMHLVEANARKCAFLGIAAARRGAPVTVHHARIEALGAAADRPRGEVVSARALAPLDRLIPLARPFMLKNALLLLPKGRSAERELTHARTFWTITAERAPSRVDPDAAVLRILEVTEHGPD
jgi:16S rRNA (guanine527-N7)-methyltransferase